MKRAEIVETDLDFSSLTERDITDMIVIHHTGCNDIDASAEQIHGLHINNGWAGIGYHFVIRKDGTIERGRAENLVGAHVTGHNSDSIGICFEGNFETETMGEAQKNAGAELVEYLKKKYSISTVVRHKDLAATACPGKNFPFEEILQGVRIGNDNSGWVPVFDRYGDKVHTGFNPSGADEWGFRNNSLSWQDVTQIEAVTALTESIGAFIITEPNSIGAGLPPEEQQQNHKKLYIRPKYNYPPWHWNASSIHWQDIWGKDSQGKQIPGNKLISTELAMDVGRSNENKADYNAVMVMGTLENQGDGTGTGFPVVELYRKGVGQGFRVYAPDIVDEKLQSAPACIEAGRPTLCETGFWLKHTLKMYSIRYPSSTDETLPPLCWPGDFVQVQEHSRVGKREKIWYGDVEAVQVDVAVNNNAVYVTQTLGINEYVG